MQELLDTSREIIAAKQKLRDLSYFKGTVNASYTPELEDAIVAFKRDKGLRPRPYFGPITEAALQTAWRRNQRRESETLPWLAYLNSVRGLDERRHRTTLMEFLRRDGKALGDPTVFPWCGDLVETCIRLGLPTEPFAGALAKNPYWARNWAEFGVKVDPMRARGCVGVWPRGKGGHVAFIVGHDSANWYVDGGNQSNMVNRVLIKRSRPLLAARYPITFDQREPLPRMTRGDLQISTNEA